MKATKTQDEAVKEATKTEETPKRYFFFPRQGRSILASSMGEAQEILAKEEELKEEKE